jgi:predicted metal-binding protein
MAERLGMLNAKIISPSDIYFDARAILKCKWGCDDPDTKKCNDRGIPYELRIQIIKSYQKILLIHSHDARKLYHTALEIERQAFLEGNRYAFTLNSCNFCISCEVLKGNECVSLDKIRPCDQLFGIDTYKTVKKLGLPCEVLKDKNTQPNRYAYILID